MKKFLFCLALLAVTGFAAQSFADSRQGPPQSVGNPPPPLHDVKGTPPPPPPNGTRPPLPPDGYGKGKGVPLDAVGKPEPKDKK